jgi:stringent starvation protein B
MSQVLDLAKQGDADAIAALMNRSLTPQGVKARVILQGTTLQILLESLEIPAQERLCSYIVQGLRKIGTPTIQRLELFGKQSDCEGYAWTENYQVEGDSFTLISAIASEVLGGTPITPSQDVSGLDSAAMITLAKTGQIDAIEAFVKLSLADREDIIPLIELDGSVLKVIIETKQFLDGQAFCAKFGGKMNALTGGIIKELAVYKRRNEKSLPFLMNQMTLFSNTSHVHDVSAVDSSENLATIDAPTEAPVTPAPVTPPIVTPEPSEDISGLDDTAIIKLAKTGQIDAIEAFVKLSLADREDVIPFVELDGSVLKVIIETKQFLDGQAFCAKFGGKMNALTGGIVKELAVYKRRNEKSLPFLMNQMTLFSNTPSVNKIEKVEKVDNLVSAVSSSNARPNGQSSAMGNARMNMSVDRSTDREIATKPQLDTTRVVAAVVVLGALVLFLVIQVPRIMSRFGFFGYFALVMAMVPAFKFYRFFQPLMTYILTGK